MTNEELIARAQAGEPIVEILDARVRLSRAAERGEDA